MINIASNSAKVAYGIKHFNLDEVVDLTDLDKSRLTPGSTVFIISTSKYYMLNGRKKWVEINPFGLGSSVSGGGDSEGDGGTGGGDIETGDDIYDGGSIDGSDPV